MDNLYWSYSYYELIQRVDLKYGTMIATQLAQYNGLVQVVSAALGGGSTEGGARPGGGSPVNEIAYGEDVDMATLQINRLLMLG